MMSSNDTDREAEALARIINRSAGGAFDLSMDAVTGAEICRITADAILTEFLPRHDERVQANALNGAAAAHQEKFGQAIAYAFTSTPTSRWLRARADTILGRRES